MTGKSLERHQSKSAKKAEQYRKLMISVERSNAARIRKSEERALAKAQALAEAEPKTQYGTKRTKNPGTLNVKLGKRSKPEPEPKPVFFAVPPRERVKHQFEDKELLFPVIDILPYERSSHKAPIGFTGPISTDWQGMTCVKSTARPPASMYYSYVQEDRVRV